MQKRELTASQVKLLKRLRGENNLTIAALARELKISRFTLYPIIKGEKLKVQNSTFNKINDWIIEKCEKEI
ncbi:hypothetical protein [Ligilactobacillus equi]|uniref:hypothetical protein n=1 Tax=Ligilactobacillus equi TaxID=137357 RepID=UPI00046A93BF|nr:hypothetical protein [Ligilactobacillus equi]